jgi:hypothetical protein
MGEVVQFKRAEKLARGVKSVHMSTEEVKYLALHAKVGWLRARRAGVS